MKPIFSLFFAIALIPLAAWTQGKQNKDQLERTCHYDEVLTMDVWTSYAPPYAIQSFKKYINTKYNKNIDFHVRRVLAPDEFFDRVRAGITDVISPSHNFFKDVRTNFIKNEMVLPLDAKLIPNLKFVNAKYVTNDFVTEKGKLYGVPLAAGGYSLLYDKKYFKTPPTSWEILWEPEFKHRYAISKDFYEANIYITALALGLAPNKINDIAVIATPKFKAKLRQLLENAVFWQGAPKASDLTKVVLTTAWGVSHSVTPDTEKKWQMAFTQEGVTFWTDYLAVTKNVERNPFAKTVAMEWLNFVLSQEYQDKAVIQKRYLSPLSLTVLPRSVVINRAEAQFLYDHSIYWPVLTVRDRNGLKMIYDEAMRDAEALTQPKR